jgi:hypothetical protein
MEVFSDISLPAFLAVLWMLPWTGVALWKAAKNSHKKWFIALFLINSLAILEIFYIFVFSKRISQQKNKIVEEKELEKLNN